MARIAGIQIEKNAKGTPTHVRINLKKHGEKINPILEELGAIEEDEFERKWKTSITGDEVFNHVIEHLKSLPWDK